jgi:single-strand DNA-binding protein
MSTAGRLLGRIGNEPEVRYTQAGMCVVTVSVAGKRKWRKDASQDENDKPIWWTVTLWGKLGEKFDKDYTDGRAGKGAMVLFDCANFEPEVYTGRDGTEKFKMVTTANEFTVVSQPKERAAEEGSYMAGRGSTGGAASRRRQDSTYKRPEEDYANDVPF